MDISILRYLDILIGFAMVMVLTSSFVTLLTQMVHSLNKTRAMILEQGIAALLKRAEPRLGEHASDIAQAVLRWQHASGDNDNKRDVIVREQLIRILLEIVADPSPADPQIGISQDAKDALAKLFADVSDQLDGTAYAQQLLEKIDRSICELETKNPDLATHVIQAQAIVEAKAGKFVDAIMTRFDNVSESMSAIFTAHSHRVTFLLALLVALALPLDTIDLLQRLSSDDKLRDVLVTEAIKETASDNQTQMPNPNQNNVKASPSLQPTNANNNTLDDIDIGAVKKAYAELNDPQLNLISRGGWSKILEFDQPSLGYYLEFILGCFLTGLLLSIGAPFWFEALKDLLNLRSSLAKADDSARNMRMTDQTKITNSSVES